MKRTKNIKDAAEILGFLADYELLDSVFWRTDGVYAPITFIANVNDVFYWACADAEDFDATDISDIRQAIIDLTHAFEVAARSDGKEPNYVEIEQARSWAFALWACRKRGQRPQTALLDGLCEEVRQLFLDCGPAHTQYGSPEEKEYMEAVVKAKGNVSWVVIGDRWKHGDPVEKLQLITGHGS